MSDPTPGRHRCRRSSRPPRGRSGLLAALLVSLVVSCASVGRGSDAPPEPSATDARSPEATLASAAAAADSGEHADAVRLLEQVRERCGRSPATDRASLLLAAVHLDPRFSGGSPQAAAETMAEHLRRGAGPAWAAPLARTLYLEALEKGARAPDPAGLAPEDTDARQPRDEVPAACGDAAAAPDLAPLRVLPSLPGTPMAERLRRLRDRVADLEQELERIRDVLDEP